MKITIYTDGSSRGNPGPGGWGAIIHWDSEIRELGGRDDNTTNNKMELSAAINALMYVHESRLKGEIILQTDSKYLISGITQWIKGWRENGWKTKDKRNVENRDLWEALQFVVSGLDIEWLYIAGHSGHPGNERCDEIATSFALGKDPGLYHGQASKYPVDIKSKPDSSRPKISRKAKAFSYLSLVDGVLMRHATWEECKSRVHGVKEARYKKALDEADEEAIKKGWGF